MSEDTPQPRQDSALETVFYHTDEIQFVNWREFSGAKPTVVLTGGITIVSFITGLSNLSQGATLAGPLASVLPAAGLFAQFSGVMFAFVLGVTTVGLQRRKRVAWYATVALLPPLGLLPLVTLQPTDVPLLVLVTVTVPLLVRNRGQFDQSLDLSPLQIASLLSIVGVVVYGTVGSYGLRDQFSGEPLSWVDAFYYVIVTIATVGYGDFTPTTPEAKWFSLTVILFGTGAFTVAVGSLIVPAIESRMAAAFGNMSASELKLLEDHVLVLGYGDITESLLEELADETDVVVVTDDENVASDLDDEGVSVLTDDPADDETLADASIDAARGVVVATRDDARDVLAVLAVRNAAPDIRVVAAANHEKNVEKLEQVGADEVISPMSIGGRLLGRSVLGEATTEQLFESIEESNATAGEEDATPGSGRETTADEDGPEE